MMPELMVKGALAVALFAAAAMTLGNMVAIVQQNIKRFMAFSAISQAGYLIMGFVGGLAEGVPAMLYLPAGLCGDESRRLRVHHLVQQRDRPATDRGLSRPFAHQSADRAGA